MKFRIWTILWVFALLASAMATFGGWGGIMFGSMVIWFCLWASRISNVQDYSRFVVMLVMLIGAAFMQPVLRGTVSFVGDLAGGTKTLVELNLWKDVYPFMVFSLLAALPTTKLWPQTE